MYKLKGSPGRTITIAKKELLYFSATACMCISNDPDFLALLKRSPGRGSVPPLFLKTLTILVFTERTE